ncbi:MAG: sulfotransferase domain-containing protein [Phycisphaeraceae bacterium]|nr:MAG: sulfotransferase domain-containing protein [Phycisphaeraceae bacterium]
MPITWLASYPKSGNTWLRFLLANLLAGGPPESSLDVSRRIPDIHRPDDPYDPPDDGREFIKTHFMRSESHPRLAETARVVHVVRHPRDVLLSALNYRRMEGVIEPLSDAQYTEMFIRNSGDALWARLGYGTWIQHAASWAQATAWPVLTIKYEDLKADTAAVLRRVLAFVEVDVGENEIERAVKQSTFDNLRALEIRERTASAKTLFPGSARDTKARRFFFNKGATGQSLDPIKPGLDRAFEARFRPALDMLGYA